MTLNLSFSLEFDKFSLLKKRKKRKENTIMFNEDEKGCSQ